MSLPSHIFDNILILVSRLLNLWFLSFIQGSPPIRWFFSLSHVYLSEKKEKEKEKQKEKEKEKERKKEVFT